MAVRGNSKRARPAPYPGQSRRPASTELPPGDPDAKWGHDGFDLFEGTSSLYQPKVSISLFAAPAPKPTPSLQPFGSFTPAATIAPASAPIPAPAPARATQAQGRSRGPKRRSRTPPELVDASSAPLAARLGPTDVSLLARLGIDVDQPLLQRNRRHPARAQARRPPSPPPRVSPPPVYSQPPAPPVQPVKQMRADMAPAPVVAPRAKVGVRVEIGGLVDGTSAEDVKIAFGQFGTILSSRIVQRIRKPTDPEDAPRTLVAEVVFEAPAAADKAVETLHGALADGQPLQVRIKPDASPAPRAQQPPPQPRPQPQEPPNLLARLGVAPAPSRQQQQAPRQPQQAPRQPASAPPAQSAAFQTSIPSTGSGKMLADQLERIDPRSSVQWEPAPLRLMSDREIDEHARWAKQRANTLLSRLDREDDANDMDLS